MRFPGIDRAPPKSNPPLPHSSSGGGLANGLWLWRAALARRSRYHSLGGEFIAQIATQHPAERGADAAEQERHECPEREIFRALTCGVSRFGRFCLGAVDDVVDFLLGVVLAHAGLSSDNLREISTIVVRQAIRA